MTDETFLTNLLTFTRLLHQAGLPVSPGQSRDFALALTLVDIGSREQVYHTARSLLVTRSEHLDLFTTIFNRFWRTHGGSQLPQAQKMPVAPRHNRPPEQFNIVSYMAYKAKPTDEEIDIADKSGTFSRAELLGNKLFADMTPEELETIKQLMQEIRWALAQRRTRRRR